MFDDLRIILLLSKLYKNLSHFIAFTRILHFIYQSCVRKKKDLN